LKFDKTKLLELNDSISSSKELIIQADKNKDPDIVDADLILVLLLLSILDLTHEREPLTKYKEKLLMRIKPFFLVPFRR
jgi:hypothetical protein